MTSNLDHSNVTSQEHGSLPDPEFVKNSETVDPPLILTWKDRINIFGLLRLVVGQIRDSAGRPNNILGLLYAYLLFFFVAIWWSLSPVSQRYVLDVYCQGNKGTATTKMDQKSTSKAEKVLDAITRRLPAKRSEKVAFLCSGATIQATVNLAAPPPLPASFFWVLVIPFCCLLAAYLARRPEMRDFMKSLLLAYRQQGRDINWKDRVFDMFASKEEKKGELSVATETKTIPLEPTKEREH